MSCVYPVRHSTLVHIHGTVSVVAGCIYNFPFFGCFASNGRYSMERARPHHCASVRGCMLCMWVCFWHNSNVHGFGVFSVVVNCYIFFNSNFNPASVRDIFTYSAHTAHSVCLHTVLTVHKYHPSLHENFSVSFQLLIFSLSEHNKLSGCTITYTDNRECDFSFVHLDFCSHSSFSLGCCLHPNIHFEMAKPPTIYSIFHA